MNHASATKLMVKQVQEWDLPCFRSDYSSPSNHYKSALSRKTSGTPNVIGGQTGTISQVEEQRRHNIEGNNIQVLSKPSDTEPTPTKMPPSSLRLHPTMSTPPLHSFLHHVCVILSRCMGASAVSLSDFLLIA
ncbi:pre-mRNA 3'-end-processing factor FIP1-like isoform X2 [Oncorhynchus mykiss]|uniref:pre-mRNA 3'-end-processing factor FIP1-like isoform X2 n=1 Tax=Oncorhynchus mykiss TaxID=8022 RepID=UPI0018775BFB|nr:pre-mRNA 3'-end-processing factor FIP1-like isoform X2 [Oncorhynchus mykiss]